MSETIWVAIITAGAAVLSNWFIYRKGRKEDSAERARLDQKTADRLSHLEKKIDVHNGYAKRFEDIGKDIAEIRTALEFIKNK